MNARQYSRTETTQPVRARWVSTRRGSVLILAVAILVLLAAIGAAYLSVTRDERVGSQQHVANTQIDLLVDGVIAMTKAAISSEIFDNTNTINTYRPYGSTTYQPWDCSLPLPVTSNTNTAGTWIADRIPTVNSAGTVIWNSISWPIVSNAAGGGFQFDLPNSTTPHTLTFPKGQFAPAAPIVINGALYPALQEYNGATPVGAPFLAGDADGDGIADSGLIKLAQLSGVTYYYAMRIVDNNSALNVNTAWAQQADFAAGENTGALQNKGFFPTNIGMREMFATYNIANYSSSEMNALNLIRFGYGTGPGPGFASLVPIDDSGNTRTDFNFISQGDAFWMQAGRRLDNPGYNSSSSYYAPIAWTEMQPLMYHMCLRDSTMLPGVLETAMPQTLYNNAPTAAYPAANFNNWYNTNFNYDSSSYNIRPLLVTRNGVNNTMQPVYAPATIQQNFSTVSTDYNGDTLQDDQLINSATSNDSPAAMLPYNTPVQARASINTATFPELWRNFWCLMAGSPSNVTPFGTAGANGANPIYDPYVASRSPYTHPQHMFRSSIRDTSSPFNANTMRFYPEEMLQLRSALAALNLLALRSGTPNVISQTLELEIQGNAPGNHGCYTTIYSAAPQPYITEVYANTDKVTALGGKTNPVGYYAIELYNPYPYAISLLNWQLVTGPSSLSNLVTFSSSPPSVPANGYLVLENYRAAATGNDAKYRPLSANAQPASATCTYFYVAGLDGVAGSEAIFLRPRLASGALSSGFDGRNYSESNTYDLVPVDQFDFTGLPAATSAAANLLHYCRASGPGNAWKFVYPGHYDGAKTSMRVEGTQQTPFTPGSAQPALAAAAEIGGPNATPSYSNPYSPIQLSAYGWAGANPVTGFTNNAYPFGEFARNGDLLQVPFFGGYRIAERQDNGNDKLKAVIDMMSPSMDCSFADDADPSDNGEEQLGRFCPLTSSDLSDDRIGTAVTATTTVIADPHRLEGASYFTNTPFTLKITSGPALNQCRLVSAYSPGSITVSPGFSTAPGANATYLLTKTAQGTVTSATATTVVDTLRSEAAGTWVGWDLNITQGPGVGQSQIVTAFTGNTLTVANSWTTTPTSASSYSLTRQRFKWATRLFDYFSVLNPNDDYLPNLDPNNPTYAQGPFTAWKANTAYAVGTYVTYLTTNYLCTTAAPKMASPPPSSYWSTYWTVVPGLPMPVANVTAGVANGGKEDIDSIDGLININTAPWPVLNMLPMVALASNGQIDTVNNEKLAKAIVAYRQMAGPFQTLYDLNKVIDFNNPTCGFQNGYGTIIFDNTAANDPGPNQGDFSGNGSGGTDGVRNDFEEKFLMLNRISNLITTRSDSYTVYIQVQGWQGVPSNPVLVVQRRASYACDRSKLTNPANLLMNVINGPAN